MVISFFLPETLTNIVRHSNACCMFSAIKMKIHRNNYGREMCVQFLWSLRRSNGVSHSPFILNEDASNETFWLILQSFVNTTFNVNERHILEVETSCNEMLPFLLFVPCTLKGHFEWLLLTLEHIFFRNSSFIRAIYLYECCYKWIYYIFMIARCHVWHFCSGHFVHDAFILHTLRMFSPTNERKKLNSVNSEINFEKWGMDVFKIFTMIFASNFSISVS